VPAVSVTRSAVADHKSGEARHYDSLLGRIGITKKVRAKRMPMWIQGGVSTQSEDGSVDFDNPSQSYPCKYRMSILDAEADRIDLIVKWPPNSNWSQGRPAPNGITNAPKPPLPELQLQVTGR